MCSRVASHARCAQNLAEEMTVTHTHLSSALSVCVYNTSSHLLMMCNTGAELHGEGSSSAGARRSHQMYDGL